MNIRERLQKENPDAELLFMDEEEFDKAIVYVARRRDKFSGIATKAVVYDTKKVIEVNMSMGMTYEDAVEWFGKLGLGCSVPRKLFD